MYDKVGDVCMCVYDDVGVINDFLMSRSTPHCGMLNRASWLDQINEHSDLLVDRDTSRSTDRARVQNALCFLAR